MGEIYPFYEGHGPPRDSWDTPGRKRTRPKGEGGDRMATTKLKKGKKVSKTVKRKA